MTITDYYVTTDAMGSVMAVLDETGNVLERRSYDAFGEATYMLPDGTVVPDSPTGVDIGFQGQLMDQLTGLYQMGYRWYSSVLGRWLSRDPIGLEGGVNPMAFVANKPVCALDPLGLLSIDIGVDVFSAKGELLTHQEFNRTLTTSPADFCKRKLLSQSFIHEFDDLAELTKQEILDVFSISFNKLTNRSVKLVAGMKLNELIEVIAKAYALESSGYIVYSKITIKVSGEVGCGCIINFDSSEYTQSNSSLMKSPISGASTYSLTDQPAQFLLATIAASDRIAKRMEASVVEQMKNCKNVKR